MKEMTDEYAAELQDNYINGMEDGVMMVKRIFELSDNERIKHFGAIRVDRILDKFDFQQLHEILQRPELKPDKVLKKYYIIQGFDSFDNITDVSNKLRIEPTVEMIEAFLLNHSFVDYVTVIEIYVRE